MLPFRFACGPLSVAFSTRDDGDMADKAHRTAWVTGLAPGQHLVVPRQVHGIAIADADGPYEALLTADAVIGRQGHALGALGADCPGIVIWAGDVFATAHCGWRGTAAGLAGQVVERLRSRSGQPSHHWHAFIGPGISGSCYEVDRPVLGARHWPDVALRPGRDPDHALLDLRATLREDLLQAGVGTVVVSDVCTASTPALHSYRMQGKGITQLLVAWYAVEGGR